MRWTLLVPFAAATVAAAPAPPPVAPRLLYVAGVGGPTEFVLCKDDGTKPEKVAGDGKEAILFPAVSKDGKKIAFTSTRDGPRTSTSWTPTARTPSSCWNRPTPAGARRGRPTARRSPSAGSREYQPGNLGDGRRRVERQEPDQRRRLRRRPDLVAGRQADRVTCRTAKGAASASTPWTPTAPTSRNWEKENGLGYGYPAWSPDGKKIAYGDASADGFLEVHVIDSDGANRKQVTTLRGQSSVAAWSPDSKRIAFHSAKSGGSTLYVMDADGGNLKAVVEDAKIPLEGGRVCWRP